MKRKGVIYKTLALCVIVVFECALFCGCGDETPPEIGGIEDVVEVQCGTDFNLTEYLDEKIKVTDDSGEDIDYKVKCDKKVYDSKTGEIDTSQYGEYKVTLTATDNAENSTDAEFTLKLNPIHVTKENKTPIIYDGKYGKISFVEASHGYIDGIDQYEFILDVENDTDTSVDVYFGSSSTTINKYQTGAYYTIAPIGAGNRGKAEISIYDEDIPEDVGTIREIVTAVAMTENTGDDEAEGTKYVRVPMIIDVSVIGD